MADSLRISKSQLQEIVEFALACKPEEACGLLAGGSDGTVSRVYLMENSEHSSASYMLESSEQFKVFEEIEREGMELVAVFHSHPFSDAYPSSIDRELAFYPGSIYLIISLTVENPVSRAFRITDKKVHEVKIILDEEN